MNQEIKLKISHPVIREIFKGRKVSKRAFNYTIRQKSRSIQIWTEGATANWEGTYWKDKKQVLNDLREKEGELNLIYDAFDEFTGTKNARTML